MFEYKLVKKLGSYENFKILKSMAKEPRHNLFAQDKLSMPTVVESHVKSNYLLEFEANLKSFRTQERGLGGAVHEENVSQKISLDCPFN
jgi:hypothetical protein